MASKSEKFYNEIYSLISPLNVFIGEGMENMDLDPCFFSILKFKRSQADIFKSKFCLINKVNAISYSNNIALLI